MTMSLHDNDSPPPGSNGSNIRSIPNLIAFYEQSLDLLPQAAMHTQQFVTVGKTREAINKLINALRDAYYEI